ncbi:ESPR domain-containing protein [Taylorella asinigenitalis]|nr:ESPR domain-containing protein [Taylorella asinigenitalis]
MNKIFKTVYNEVIGSWVAVSEITKTGGKNLNPLKQHLLH